MNYNYQSLLERNMTKLYEECYDECVKVGWNPVELEKVSDRLFLHVNQIKNYARLYMTQILHMSRTDVDEYFGCIKKIYYEEPKIHNKSDIVFRDLRLSKENTNSIDWITNVGIPTMTKYCYDCFEDNHWNDDTIHNLSHRWSCAYSTIRDYAIYYLTNIKNMDKEEVKKHIKESKLHKNSGIYFAKKEELDNIYELLYNSQSIDEIYEIISNSSLELDNLYDGLYHYEKSNSEENSKKIDKIKYALKQYKNRVSVIAKRSEKEKKNSSEKDAKLLEALSFIKLFVDGEYESEKFFCDINNIRMDKLSEYKKTVQINEPKLYEIYSEKLRIASERIYKRKSEEIRKVIKLLQDGIEVDGDKNPANLFDYYCVTKFSLEEMYEIASEVLSKEQLHLFYKFYMKNKDVPVLKERDINAILKEKMYVGCQCDKKGNPIYETGREITVEDKEYVINYLRYNNNLNARSYNIALRMYLNNQLNNENNYGMKLHE